MKTRETKGTIFIKKYKWEKTHFLAKEESLLTDVRCK